MSTPDQARLLAARWLALSGAGASACRVLGGMRGPDANDLREASATSTLRLGIYALVVHEDDGLVFPMQARVGVSSSASVDLRASCNDALAAARAWFGMPRLPSLRLELEELLAVSGTSLGLPAALAFVTHFAPGSSPARAIIATGRIDAEGRVLEVAHVDTKLAAAAAERGERLVLVPRGQRRHDDEVEVGSLEEAIAAALGPSRTPAASLVAVDAMIERARAESDPKAALSLLEAIDLAALSSADRARMHLELGTVLRHAGRSEAAAEHHARARALFETERLVVGAETAERFELETWLTAMDGFRLDDARAAIAQRMREPFLSVRNELRCRGMLAQVLAMQGELSEAVRVREGNLPLHALSDDLARVLPGTLCYLALDSARAGDVGRFARYSQQLLAATRPGDATQWRYTTYAIVRSLVALGRFREAESEAKTLLSGTEPIATHPEITLIRVLARAYRRLGEPEKAIALGARVAVTSAATGSGTGAGADLVAWLARLALLEVALAERDLGRDPAARIVAARADLASLHAAATNHHRGLVTCAIDPPAALEVELDRVYY